MDKTDYFIESLSSSFDEHGLEATDAQIKAIAEDIQLSAEVMEQAFGRVDNPLSKTILQLQEELKSERSKEKCHECKGLGEITIEGPYHCSTFTCPVCKGEGRV